MIPWTVTFAFIGDVVLLAWVACWRMVWDDLG